MQHFCRQGQDRAVELVTDSTPSSESMTCYSTSSDGQGSPVDRYKNRGHNYLPWTYQSTALSWMSLAVGHKTDIVFTIFPPLQPINKPKRISHGQRRQTIFLEKPRDRTQNLWPSITGFPFQGLQLISLQENRSKQEKLLSDFIWFYYCSLQKGQLMWR